MFCWQSNFGCPRRSKSDRTVEHRIRGESFVRSFAQHVLPGGFQKIRYYGWMSPNSKLRLEAVKWLVWLYLGWTFWLGSGHAPQPEPLTVPLFCAACGGRMRVTGVTFDPMAERSIRESHRGLAYFGSG